MEENVYNNCIWYYIYTLLLLYISTSIINKSIYRERYLYSRIYICCLLVQMGCTPLIFAVTLVTRHAKGGRTTLHHVVRWMVCIARLSVETENAISACCTYGESVVFR